MDENELSTLYYKELVEHGIAPDKEQDSYTWEDVNKVTNYYREELPIHVADQMVKESPKLAQDLMGYILHKGDNLV